MYDFLVQSIYSFSPSFCSCTKGNTVQTQTAESPKRLHLPYFKFTAFASVLFVPIVAPFHFSQCFSLVFPEPKKPKRRLASETLLNSQTCNDNNTAVLPQLWFTSIVSHRGCSYITLHTKGSRQIDHDSIVAAFHLQPLRIRADGKL